MSTMHSAVHTIHAHVTENGRKVATVARAIDMRPDTLRAKLRGDRPLYLYEIEGIARTLGTLPSALVTDTLD